MAQSQQCKEYGSTLPNDLIAAVHSIATAEGPRLHSAIMTLTFLAGIATSVLSNPQLLCSDSELQLYLHDKKYQLHPCQAVLQEMQKHKICRDFSQDLVAPVEVSSPPPLRLLVLAANSNRHSRRVHRCCQSLRYCSSLLWWQCLHFVSKPKRVIQVSLTRSRHSLAHPSLSPLRPLPPTLQSSLRRIFQSSQCPLTDLLRQEI
jgi:hypothetical protein